MRDCGKVTEMRESLDTGMTTKTERGESCFFPTGMGSRRDSRRAEIFARSFFSCVVFMLPILPVGLSVLLLV